jgi:hypothetical protein
MATQATYYLDAPSLASASVIYTDSSLTTIAPDGFYSDGTLVREQASGILLPQTTCPTCATPCGGAISASGQQGVYYLDIDLGTDVGAVEISFDPYSVPDGIQAVFNSVTYNGLSSPAFGWLQGSAGLATYIGDSANNCGLPPVGTLDLDVFNYEGGSFVPSGETEAVSILAGQLDLTTGAPGSSRMVIAKTAPTPSILSLKMIGPCSGTAFNVAVACPAGLTAFDASLPFVSSTLACAAPISQVYYVSHVTGSAGVLGLNDLVFDDSFGQYKLAAGYYRTNDAGANTWFQVDIYGVVRAFGVCSSGGTTFNASVGSDAASACEGGVPLEVVGNNAVFCSCTQFTSVAFEEYASGVYYLSYGGYSIAIAVTAGSSVAIVEGPCVACAEVSSVTGVNGYMEPCIGGTVDDHMGAAVFLDAPVAVDTEFEVQVSYVFPGNSCGFGNNTQTFFVTVLAGETVSNFNACSSGYYISGGANICSACIVSCDNSDVDLTGFTC